MNEIEKQVSTAKRRLNVAYFFRTLAIALTIGLTIGCVAFLAPRIWSTGFWETPEQLRTWETGWAIGAIVLSLMVAIMWVVRKGFSTSFAAYEVDRRFGLKDRVTSALELGDSDRDSRAGRSLVYDANERAARLDVRDAFPYRFNRRTLWPLLPAAIMIGLMFIPQADKPEPEAATNTATTKEEIRKSIEAAKLAVEEKAKALEEKGLKKAAEDLKIISREFDELPEGDEDFKKETLVKLNDLKNSIEKEMEKMGDVDAMKKAFDKLNNVKDGPAKELGEALKDGDFENAKNVLKDLAEKIRDGKLSEAEKQKLADNLGDLAKEIEKKVAEHEQKKKDLENQIKRAMEEGDTEKAAELQEQLEQKKQQDKQMNKMQEMAQKLSQCKDCMNKGGKPKDGSGKGQQGQQQGDGKQGENSGSQQAEQDAAETLEQLAEEMENLQADSDAMETLKDLEKDLEECKGQCQGQGQPGEQEKIRQQDWAKGEGRGHGKRDMEENDTGTFKSRVGAKLQQGQTVVTGQADGENSKSQSIIEARESLSSSLQSDSDPMEDQQLPRAQREQAKQYFEKLRKGN
ncbi:MAG: hypothetical protein R3C03_15570 [Pirellulaceae bacterium]